jgi:hypothetical protein
MTCASPTMTTIQNLSSIILSVLTLHNFKPFVFFATGTAAFYDMTILPIVNTCLLS